MAQTLSALIGQGQGWASKLKIEVLRLNNSLAETTYTLTAALAGMTLIAAVIPIDETAAAAIKATPTVDAATGLYTQVALTFTGGDELTLLVIGV